MKLAEQLVACGACQLFTAEEAERLAASGTLREVGPGEALVREGDDRDDMLILLAGAGVVFKHDGDRGEPVRLNPVGAGEMIGAASMLACGKSAVSVEATEPCKVFVLSHDSFLQLLRDGDAVAHNMTLKIARNLADRLALVNATFFEFLRTYADQQPKPAEFESFKSQILKQWDV